MRTDKKGRRIYFVPAHVPPWLFTTGQLEHYFRSLKFGQYRKPAAWRAPKKFPKQKSPLYTFDQTRPKKRAPFDTAFIFANGGLVRELAAGWLQTGTPEGGRAVLADAMEEGGVAPEDGWLVRWVRDGTLPSEISWTDWLFFLSGKWTLWERGLLGIKSNLTWLAPGPVRAEGRGPDA